MVDDAVGSKVVECPRGEEDESDFIFGGVFSLVEPDAKLMRCFVAEPYFST